MANHSIAHIYKNLYKSVTGIGSPEDFLLHVPAWGLLAGAHTAVAAMPCWASHGQPEILIHAVVACVSKLRRATTMTIRMETHLVSDSNCNIANL